MSECDVQSQIKILFDISDIEYHLYYCVFISSFIEIIQSLGVASPSTEFKQQEFCNFLWKMLYIDSVRVLASIGTVCHVGKWIRVSRLRLVTGSDTILFIVCRFDLRKSRLVRLSVESVYCHMRWAKNEECKSRKDREREKLLLSLLPQMHLLHSSDRNEMGGDERRSAERRKRWKDQWYEDEKMR